MQSSSVPKRLPIPFANSGDKQNIPDTSQVGIVDGRASYPDGFPALTRTPISAGGVPPFGTDMNGILFEISSTARWSAAGGTYKFDSSFSTAIGGYPKGAILGNSGGDGLWINLIENNTSNPDAAGPGWDNPLRGRLLKTSIYTKISGQQYASVNGGTPTATGSTVFIASPLTKAIEVECQAGGSGGGGAQANGTMCSVAGGGGGGTYARGRFTTWDASLAVTVGAGGAGGAAGNNNGSTGGVSSVGSLVVCNPGFTGAGGSPAPTPFFNGGTAYSQSPSGANLYAIRGGGGGYGTALSSQNAASGVGGSSHFGAGAPPATNGTGVNAVNYGTGGSGGSLYSASILSVAGGDGAPGIVIIYEYS